MYTPLHYYTVQQKTSEMHRIAARERLARSVAADSDGRGRRTLGVLASPFARILTAVKLSARRRTRRLEPLPRRSRRQNTGAAFAPPEGPNPHARAACVKAGEAVLMVSGTAMKTPPRPITWL